MYKTAQWHFLKTKQNKNLQVTKSFKDKCKTQEENEQTAWCWIINDKNI